MKRCFIMLLILAVTLFSSGFAYGINSESSPEEISRLQNLLTHSGIMYSSKNIGIYDSATIGAVARFQEWVNEKMGETVLPVSGMADEQTVNYLILVANTGVYLEEEPVPEPSQTPEATVVSTQPPETPTASPVEAPTRIEYIDANSSEETIIITEPSDEIAAEEATPNEPVILMPSIESIDMITLQRKLLDLGLLNGEPSGFYDISTYSAVKEMQRRLGLDDSGVIDQEFLSLIGL